LLVSHQSLLLQFRPRLIINLKYRVSQKSQVYVQLPTSADNVALPAFAAARRAATQLLLTAGLQQRRAAARRDRRTNGQTDGRLTDA